jgi:hypothetical protein
LQGKASRVVRGGSWNNEARRLRSAYRNTRHRDNRNDNQGFRFSLSSMEQAAWMCRKPWTRRDILPVRPAAAANCKAPGAPVGIGSSPRRQPSGPPIRVCWLEPERRFSR